MPACGSYLAVERSFGEIREGNAAVREWKLVDRQSFPTDELVVALYARIGWKYRRKLVAQVVQMAVELFAELGNLVANVSSPIEVTSSVLCWGAWNSVS